ncbi:MULTISPECIES: hypothetical protein [Bacteroidota]|uniref:hypothetical protein n=1 Tax=Bacteroidota TaxID=976 RepID=UPI00241D2708|nr:MULTISPECIES: hypothetical protein [Bacteroidota]
MDIIEFQKLAEQINPLLNDDEKEERVIQIVDLRKFMACCNLDLKIIDCITSEINVVEHNNEKIGILFIELTKCTVRSSFIKTFYDKIVYQSEKLNTKRLWFVFVEENPLSDFSKFINFIENHGLSNLFDKIFLFQFYESVIHQLK